MKILRICLGILGICWALGMHAMEKSWAPVAVYWSPHEDQQTLAIENEDGGELELLKRSKSSISLAIGSTNSEEEEEDMDLSVKETRVINLQGAVCIHMCYKNREGSLHGRSVLYPLDQGTNAIRLKPEVTIENGLVALNVSVKQEKIVTLLSSLIAMISSYIELRTS